MEYETMVKSLQGLVKALEAGNVNVAPGQLTQGGALSVDDLSSVMAVVGAREKHLILADMLKTESCRSVLYQFNRQLSPGGLGYAAQGEGNVGQEETSEYIRATVPMAFYSHVRRVTHVANIVESMDGRKAEERVAEDAAKKALMDIELDSFRALEDFTTSGVFDGSPLSIPQLPGMHGIFLQIRQSDGDRRTQDTVFQTYGSSESVVVNIGGPLTQGVIEDMRKQSEINFGEAEDLIIDPRTLATYNKISFGKERIVLAGTAQDSTGATLKRQFVASGTVDIKSSHFLRGRYSSDPIRKQSPAAPTVASVTSTTIATVTTPFVAGEKYWYIATGANETGESGKSAAVQGTVVTTGDSLQAAITPGSGTNRYFNVYRSPTNGTVASSKFVGRVIAAASGNTTFIDLGNKLPGFVTCILIDRNTHEMRELKSFTREKLAQTDLSTPEAYYRFVTVVSTLPRQNTLGENATP